VSKELISRDALEMVCGEHYVSTACIHLRCSECRKTCKFCDAPCRHPCHELERITGNPVLSQPAP